MGNSYKQAIEQAKSDLKSIIDVVREVEREVAESASKMSAHINSVFKGGNTPNEFSAQVKKQSEELEKLNQKFAELTAVSEKAAVKKQEITSLITKENSAIQKQTEAISKNQNALKGATKDQLLYEQAMKKAFDRQIELSRAYTRLTQEHTKAKKALQDTILEYGKLHPKTLEAQRNFNALTSQLAALNTQLKQTKEATNKAISKEMTGRMRESVDAIGRQSEAMKRLNADFKQQEIESAKAAKAKEKEAKLTAHLSRAYVQLANEYAKAKNTLRDAIVQYGKLHPKTVQAQKDFDLLANKIRKANAATSSFSKGSLKGLFGGLKNLLGAFGVVGGAMAIAGIVKNVFALTKKLQSLDFALKTVASDAHEVARTTAFLSDITDRFGADILTTTERYTKFLAAAKQSNITLDDTEKIFRTVTKAAGVLGLKTDELSGIYLALEQMLSKGKVTTEELRRQLGERLPGAFGIMAKALDVTVPKLDKMLRAGEIMSATALPKLADALEEAYGIENVKKIDTLVAAQNRLNNSWTKMVRSFSGEGGGAGLVSLFDSISERMALVSKHITRFQQSLSFLSKGFKIFIETIRPVINAFKELTGIDLVKAAKGVGGFMKSLFSPSLAMAAVALEKITKNILGVSNLVVEVARRIKNIDLSGNPVANVNSIKGVFADLKSVYEEGYNSVDKAISSEKAAKELKEREALVVRVSALMTELAFMQGKTLTSESAEAELLGMTSKAIREKEQAIIKLLGTKKLEGDNEKDEEKRRKAALKLAEERLKNTEELTQSLIKIELEANKTILEDENNSLLAKTTANQKINNLEIKSAESKRDYEIALAKLTITDKQTLNSKLAAIAADFMVDEDKAAKEKQKRYEKAVSEEFENKKEAISAEAQLEKQASEVKIIKLNEAFAKEIALLQKQREERKLSKELFDEKYLKATEDRARAEEKIIRESAIKQLEISLKALKAFKDANVLTDPKDKLELDRAIADAEIAIDNAKTQKILKNQEDIAAGEKAIQEIKTQAINKASETIATALNLDAENLKAMFTKMESGIGESTEEVLGFIGNVVGVMGSAFLAASDRRIEKLEEEKVANNEYYTTLLDNENLSEKERSAIEAQRDAKNAEIDRKKRREQQKKAKMEKANAIIEIAINTAVAIAKATAQTGVLAPFFIPLMVALGAASIAAVLAQPIPKFEKGTKNAPEGFALVDERVPEVHTDSNDNVKHWGSSKGANLRYLSKGDKIYKNRDEFLNAQSADEINKAVWQMNLKSNGAVITDAQVDNSLLREVSGLRGDMDKMGRRIERIAGRPIKNTVKVELEDKRAY